jgi:hypothetical protein
MPLLDDPSPAPVLADRDASRTHLGAVLPAKWLDENPLIATWNLRCGIWRSGWGRTGLF